MSPEFKIKGSRICSSKLINDITSVYALNRNCMSLARKARSFWLKLTPPIFEVLLTYQLTIDIGVDRLV